MYAIANLFSRCFDCLMSHLGERRSIFIDSEYQRQLQAVYFTYIHMINVKSLDLGDLQIQCLLHLRVIYCSVCRRVLGGVMNSTVTLLSCR